MSVEVWPLIAPEELKIQEDATQARELEWLLSSLRATLESLRHGLGDCYALLAPVEPGSTLVLSTPRNETVKGHVTRVGTRIVKGTVRLRLRTLPPQTLSVDPSRPIHLPALATLHALLTESIDLASLCLAETTPTIQSAPSLAAQLRLLAQHLAEATAIIRGPASLSSSSPSSAPPSSSRPGTSSSSSSTTGPSKFGQAQASPATPTPSIDLDTAWTTSSTSLSHFTPPVSRNLSFFLTIQDGSLVLSLRALESADAPLNFGAKLALAIGTARRLEHDEADRIFGYCCDGSTTVGVQEGAAGGGSGPGGSERGDKGAEGTGGVGMGMGTTDSKKKKVEEVYVREKVRVESADPSLLSMSAKLGALANTLDLARRNLAAVMEEEME